MSQYKNGIINNPSGTVVAVNLPLGFVPDKFTIFDRTVAGGGTGILYSEWNNSLPSGYAELNTITSGMPAYSLITTAGITPVAIGGDWQNTIYTINTITNANPGVVTVASITPTNSMTLVNGMTVTISGVTGMTGVNTNRFIVSQLTIVGGGPTYTFKLFDTFGNPFSTVGLGTYVSGGEIDVISYPPTAPVLNPVNGQVITLGNPAGLQYDIGYEGVTLGTGVLGSSSDVLYWEAWYSSTSGY